MATYSEPDWGTPISGETPYSRYDLKPALPYDFAAAILEYLRYLFANPDQLLIPSLQSLQWTADPTTTKILIEYNLNTQKVHIGRRPAIRVVRGDFKRESLSAPLRNYSLQVQDSVGNQFFDSNITDDFIVGTLSIMCESFLPLQAELLQHEVLYDLLEARLALMDDFHLQTLEIDEASAIQISQEPDKPAVGSIFLHWVVYYQQVMHTEEPSI